jgi:hypothetical protein
MPTAPGYADITVGLRHALMSRHAALTFGVQPSATDPITVCNNVASAVLGATGLEAMMDNDVTITTIRASLGTDGSEDIVGETSHNTICDGVFAAPPPNVAVLLHKRSTRGGRRGRGRMFVPWAMSEGDVDEVGNVATARVTQLQNLANSFLAALTTYGVPMVILHNPGKTVQGAPNVVTSLTVDRLVATQRRRLGR